MAIVAIAGFLAAIFAVTTEFTNKVLTEEANFATPYGEADCRPPKPEVEFRVRIEWCNAQHDCYSSCFIEPHERTESRAVTKRRLLARIKT